MNNLKKLRNKEGISQKELSKKMGIPLRTLQSWENGESQIKISQATQLAKYFNVSLDYLLGFTGKEENNKMTNNSMVIKEYTDIPLVRSAVKDLNTDIKNNPLLKYEIVGFSTCRDDVLGMIISAILVRWEGNPMQKQIKGVTE